MQRIYRLMGREPQPPQVEGAAGLLPSTKYRAFISYSHADTPWAEWAYRQLQRYSIPKRLRGKQTSVGTIPKRITPVFLDRDEMPVGSDLPERLQEILTNSESLLVVCSPKAAASRWVNEEVRFFKSLGREDRVLCLITGGEPYWDTPPADGSPGCFPAALRYQVGPDGQLTEQLDDQPAAADVRPGKDGKRRALLKLISGILGVVPRELFAFDRRRRILQGAFAALLLIGLATAATMTFIRYRRAQRVAYLATRFDTSLAVSPSEVDALWELTSEPYAVRRGVLQQFVSDPEAAKRFNLLADDITHAVAGIDPVRQQQLAEDILPQYCYKKTPDDKALQSACMFLAARLDPNVERSLPFVLNVLEHAEEDPNQSVVETNRLELAAWLLGSMADRLSPEQAAQAGESLVNALNRISEFRADDLGRPLGVLAGRMQGERGAKFADYLLSLFSQHSHGSKRAALGEGLAGLQKGIAPAQAERCAGELLDSILSQGESYETSDMMKAVELLTPHLSSDASAKFTARIWKVMRAKDNSTGLYQDKAGIMLGLLVRQFTPEEARKFIPEVLAELLSPTARTGLEGLYDASDPVFSKEYAAQLEREGRRIRAIIERRQSEATLGPAIVSLSRHMTDAEKQKFAERLVKGIQNATESEDSEDNQIRFLAHSLESVASPATSVTVCRGADLLLAEMTSAKSGFEVASIASSYALIGKDCGAEKTQQAVALVRRAMQQPDPRLAEAVTALAEFDSHGMYAIDAPVISEILSAAEQHDKSNALADKPIKLLEALGKVGDKLSEQDAERALRLALTIDDPYDSPCPAAAPFGRVNTIPLLLELLKRPRSTYGGVFTRCDAVVARIATITGADPLQMGRRIRPLDLEGPTVQQPDWYAAFVRQPKYIADPPAFAQWAKTIRLPGGGGIDLSASPVRMQRPSTAQSGTQPLSNQNSNAQ